MKRGASAILLAAFITLAGCSGDAGYTELESGYSYKFVNDEAGRKAVMGDVMMIDWKSVYDGDSILFERTAESGFVLNPFQGPQQLLDVLELCDEGDSVHIKMSLMDYALLTRMPINASMDTTKTVEVRMLINEVENESTLIERRKLEQLEKDDALIRQYLEEKGLEATKSDDGIYHVVREEGNGPKPQNGQRASVNYTLRLTDGTLIDTSNEEVAKEAGVYNARRQYQPYTFTVGNDNVVDGWHKGIPLVNKGGKGTLLIPSGLGYGPRGRSGMPPNSILVFDVEVVDIK